MMMIIISVVLLAAAGGGGWFVYQEFLSEPTETAEQTEADAAEEAEEPPDPFLVRLTPLTMPVVRGQDIEQYITLMLQIEAVDRESEQIMQKRMPALRDSIITELYGALAVGDVLSGDLIAVAAVKKKVRTAVARIVGEGRVRDILITDVNQRKL